MRIRTRLLAGLAGVVTFYALVGTAQAPPWSLFAGCVTAIAGYNSGVGAVVGLACDNLPNGRSVVKYLGGRWESLGGGVANSITQSNDGRIWVTTREGRIYHWTGTSWHRLANRTNCEGGTMAVHDGLTWDTKIAVDSGNNLFVIAADGSVSAGTSIRRYTGTCWAKMAEGKAREISIQVGATPYVINNYDDVFTWNGSAWVYLGPGTASSLSRDSFVLGTEAPDTNVYQWWGNPGYRYIDVGARRGFATLQLYDFDDDACGFDGGFAVDAGGTAYFRHCP